MWFTQLMVHMVRKLREQYRVLAYLEEFLTCPVKAGQGREGSQYEGLPEGGTGDRQAAIIIRLDTESDEGRMGREYSSGTP
jgi:hypothetical protein